ncbi:MAG: hypothetical protein WC955_06705 [Elusimicrobiota bacterium]
MADKQSVKDKKQVLLAQVLSSAYKLSLEWPDEDDKILRIIAMKYRMGNKIQVNDLLLSLSEKYRKNRFRLGSKINSVILQKIALFLQVIGNRSGYIEVVNKTKSLAKDGYIDRLLRMMYPSKFLDNTHLEQQEIKLPLEVIALLTARNKSWIMELRDAYNRYKSVVQQNMSTGRYPLSLVQEIENMHTYREMKMLPQLRREVEDAINTAGIWKEYRVGPRVTMINELSEISVPVTLFIVEQHWMDVMKKFNDKCLAAIERTKKIRSGIPHELPGIAIGIAGWYYLNETENERSTTLKAVFKLPKRERFLTLYQISRILLDEQPINAV